MLETYALIFTEDIFKRGSRAAGLEELRIQREQFTLPNDYPVLLPLGGVELVGITSNSLSTLGISIAVLGGESNGTFPLVSFTINDFSAQFAHFPSGGIASKGGYIPLILLYSFVLSASFFLVARICGFRRSFLEAFRLTAIVMAYFVTLSAFVVFFHLFVTATLLKFHQAVFFVIYMASILVLFAFAVRSTLIGIAEFYGMVKWKALLIALISYLQVPLLVHWLWFLVFSLWRGSTDCWICYYSASLNPRHTSQQMAVQRRRALERLDLSISVGAPPAD